MDPRDRLQRRYPGEGLGDARPFGQRFFARDAALPEPRKVPGETMTLRELKVREAMPGIRPAPNAPLLKRLVHSPYRQETVSPRRQQVFEGIPWDALKREAREEREHLERPTVGNPLRDPAYGHRPEARARISADAWLAGRSR